MQIVLDVYGIITNNIRLSQNWLTLFISFQMRVTSFNDVLIMNKDETPVVVHKKITEEILAPMSHLKI